MKKKRFIRTKRKAAKIIQIEDDLFFSNIRVSLIGSQKMIIDHYTGIVEYSDTKVRLDCSEGVLCISGNELELKDIESDRISIMGHIKTLEFN
ncbi:MAG: YabP/YqfC family sporulation protein [Christensenellales bacterium]|jgi:sporulation protein YqfC